MVSTVVFFALPLYAWSRNDSLSHLAGTALLLCMVVTSLTLRTRIKIIALLDKVLVSITLLSIGLFLSGAYATPELRLAAPLMTLMMTIYVWVAWGEFTKLREKVDALVCRDTEGQRMATIGRVAGGIAHGFNNILTVIIGNLELYHEEPDRAERQKLVNNSKDAAQRASVLISQLTAYAKQTHLTTERTDLQDLSTAVVSGQVLQGRARDIVFDLPPQGPVINVDRKQLITVIVALLDNALEADPNGQITLSVKEMSVASNHPALAPWAYVEIKISDTGRGIETVNINRVSEPFFTTKPVGQGSGLGLSMAKGFAEQSRGDLRIVSTKGKGTSVSLILPVGQGNPLVATAMPSWAP